MNDVTLTKINVVIEKIKALHGDFEQAIEVYRVEIAEFENSCDKGIEHFPSSYWKLVLYVDSLIKIRLMIERNFNFIESFGLIALTRYVCELSIWIRLMSENENYGFFYYKMLLQESKERHKEQVAQFESEIAWLKSLEVKEKAGFNNIEAKNSTIADVHAFERMSAVARKISEEIDWEASRKFSIYGDEAAVNGYSYQAYLIEKNALPKAKDNLIACEIAEKEFDAVASKELEKLGIGKLKWQNMAIKAGVSEEFDFIYSYTSRLLHAKPSSLTTNQKSLENVEVLIFLRYILVKMLEILSFTQKEYKDKKLH